MKISNSFDFLLVVMAVAICLAGIGGLIMILVS